MPTNRNFEQFLLDNAVLSQNALKLAQSEALSRKLSLFQCLVEKNILTNETLAQTLARFHKIDYSPGPLKFDTALVSKFPIFTLRRYKFVPLTGDDKQVTIAIVDPGNILATDEVRRLTKLIVKITCTTEAAIAEAITRCGLPPAASTQPPLPTQIPVKQVAAATNDLNNIANQTEKIIEGSIAHAASDIHFEPQQNRGLIRERIDGILYDIHDLSLDQFTSVIARLKLLLGMDIIEKRLSQDGRLKFKSSQGSCEIRGSILPTIHGEKLVLRLLRSERGNPTLELLDAGQERNEAIKKICEMHDGLVVVAGPTGSGKSTTIYAILNQLDKKTQNIITVEDPVEYELERANQVQVNHKIGITFASTLPAILRQDPDVVMVGEIRDEDTAQMVMRAAISGHLVFSTVHAPNALQTVVRLVDMKVESHMVVAAVKACISQRLLRKLCPKCKKGHVVTPLEQKVLGLTNQTAQIYEPVGCQSCHGFGFAGRFAAMEILFLTEDLRKAILNEDKHNLEKIAKKDGFKTMREHAIERVICGDTSMTEMLSNCPDSL